MRKGFLIVIAVLLVAALAAPAMAGTDVNGFIRTKAWMSNFQTSGSAPIVDNNAPSNAFVEQRMRLKFTSGEENVKAIVQFEIDFSAFGDTAGSSVAAAERNSGGAFGGDKINLETKNVYIWFKLPNTSLDFSVGLQTQSDAYAGLLYGGADMAGIFMNGKYEPVAYTLGWAKLYENSSSKSDDLTLYLGAVKFSPSKDWKLGVNLYYVQDGTQKAAVATLPYTGLGGGALGSQIADRNDKQIWIPGIDFTWNAGPATLTGFFIYEFGTVDFRDPTLSDVDVKGYAIDLRGDMNIGPGKAFLEGLYLSGGDNNAKEVKSIMTFSDFDASPGGNSAYNRTDMQILLNNADSINCSQSFTGSRAVPNATSWGTSTSPALGGRGIIHLAAGYSMPLAKQLTGKFNVGWLQANKLLKGTDDWKKGKTLGTEINASVNYNIMKGLDVGVMAGYAFIGDYFGDKSTGADPDPDNPWTTYARLNYAF